MTVFLEEKNLLHPKCKDMNHYVFLNASNGAFTKTFLLCVI